MRINSHDLKELKILQYYRIIRRSICAQFDIKQADLEILIYLDGLGHFDRQTFIEGQYTYSWDQTRWDRLRTNGWVSEFRKRNKNQKYTIYQTSTKTRLMIMRMYRIMLGEEDIPQTIRSPFYKRESYSDKVNAKAIDLMNKDKER
ncbi:MAG: hypothetical protein ACKVJK_04675 [Methylophagaceae bacterium]|jgi:hypothetical protein|tara:strand:- start:18 stop:455 length:438 start_codon:yes stop_codon:yes gene_type:complete